jgi:hypothetical protein
VRQLQSAAAAFLASRGENPAAPLPVALSLAVRGAAPSSPAPGGAPLAGTYAGMRGYDDPGRPSPDRACLSTYTFTATVRNGRIEFASDSRRWTGRVGADGTIKLDRKRDGRCVSS